MPSKYVPKSGGDEVKKSLIFAYGYVAAILEAQPIMGHMGHLYY
jgi:hypothetical protein